MNARSAVAVTRTDPDGVVLTALASPLGTLVAGATDAGVCLLEFADHQPADTWPAANVHLEQLAAELDAYFAGRLRTFSVPLAFPGTPFQVRVWGHCSASRTARRGRTRRWRPRSGRRVRCGRSAGRTG